MISKSLLPNSVFDIKLCFFTEISIKVILSGFIDTYFWPVRELSY